MLRNAVISKEVKNRTLTKIIGIVKPSERDKSGNVVQVTIETDQFDRFTVADTNNGKELCDHINAKVSVNGYIAGEYFDGSEILFVEGYEII